MSLRAPVGARQSQNVGLLRFARKDGYYLNFQTVCKLLHCKFIENWCFENCKLFNKTNRFVDCFCNYRIGTVNRAQKLFFFQKSFHKRESFLFIGAASAYEYFDLRFA